MPYVSCPSCETVSYRALGQLRVEPCPRCGEPLPLWRRVVRANRAQAVREESSVVPAPPHTTAADPA